MNILRYSSILGQLLLTDFLLFRRVFWAKLIDLSIWAVTVVAVTGYLMPAFGIESAYGSFMVAGVCASAGLFEVFPSVMNLVSDFEGDRIISFYSTLPMPTSFVFIRLFLNYSLSAIPLTLCIVPLSKLVLWNQFDLSNMHVLKFLVALVITNFLYGALIVWVTSYVKGLETIGSVWMRFIYPMWFLGGFQFSWYVLYGFSPTLAYINLLNPLTYVMEITRVSLLGQEGYVNYWLCLAALVGFIVFFMWRGIKRLKKQLDFI
jgi:ABC-2 type transport system permease protein